MSRSSSATRPTIAAIVPATDDPPTLDRALGALRGGTSVPESTSGVRVAPRPGPASARNAGAATVDSEVLLFVDADVLVADDAVAAIRARFAAEPDLAALFGCYDAAPEAPGLVSAFRNLLHHHVHASSPGPAETFWAGLGAVRRSDFERVGGFDERRFGAASVEDIELGARLSASGARIVLDPAITGKHLKRWTLASMVSTDLRRRGIPWARLVLEGRAPRGGLNLGPRHRLSAAAALLAVAAVIQRRPTVLLAASWSLVVANRRFYALLSRFGGIRLGLAGPPLHAVHHLTGVAALSLAALQHAFEGVAPAPAGEDR